MVIGSSMAGMLAARVLLPHFARVTVFERDALPDGPEARKGVPQGRHFHGLLARGAQILEALFPGIFAELTAEGALYLDAAADLRWLHHDVWKARYQSNVKAYSLGRPLLEQAVRRHLLKAGNVRLVDQAAVSELLTNSDRTQLTGVRVMQGDREESIAADLVVDASGRGSRSPQWLGALGCGEPPVSTLKVDVAYASRIYRRPASLPDWQVMILFAKPPARRSGIIASIDGNRWIVTLFGYFGDHPPVDEEGFLAFARTLPSMELYEAIRQAEPLGPAAQHKLPSQLRRHYERMQRFPEGYVILGDAACSFNPVYGQGMTTAALGAEALGACLDRQPPGSIAGLSRRVQKEIARVDDIPWMLATGEDYRFPDVAGPRPAGQGLLNWYTERLLKLTAHDTELATEFLRVQQMLKPPTALFAPRIMWKVMTGKA